MKTLFKTIEDLQDFVPSAKSSNLEVMNPHIITATRTYLVPVIGEDLYKEVLKKYHSAIGITDDDELELLRNMQEVIGNFAYRLAIPQLNIVIGNNGLSRIENDTHKSAFQYQVVSVQKSFFEIGHSAVENLLSFLERYKNELFLKEWKNSAQYFENKDFFVPSMTVFQKFVNIKNKRWHYLQMRNLMREIERTYILPLLSKDFFNQIKEQLKTDTLNKDFEDLLYFVRYAVCYQTLLEDLNQRLLIADAEGVLSVPESNSTQTISSKKGAAPNRIQVTKDFFQDKAKFYLAQIESELQNNIRNYPLFEQSNRVKTTKINPIIQSKKGNIITF